MSGGVDSSYLALKIKEYGLRPLVIHVDAGWNSELAVFNIERGTAIAPNFNNTVFNKPDRSRTKNQA